MLHFLRLIIPLCLLLLTPSLANQSSTTGRSRRPISHSSTAVTVLGSTSTTVSATALNDTDKCAASDTAAFSDALKVKCSKINLEPCTPLMQRFSNSACRQFLEDPKHKGAVCCQMAQLKVCLFAAFQTAHCNETLFGSASDSKNSTVSTKLGHFWGNQSCVGSNGCKMEAKLPKIILYSTGLVITSIVFLVVLFFACADACCR